MRTIKILLAAGFLLVFGTSIHAQVQRNETYLQLPSRPMLSIGPTSTPNLGIEVGLAKKLTLDISGNYNPWKFGDDRQIKHWLVQPELRYWLCERFNGSFFGLHGHYGEMNVSNLNIFGMGHDRYDGNLYGAGISYGYQWIISKRWSMELPSEWDTPVWNMISMPVVTEVKSWDITPVIISARPKSVLASFMSSNNRTF
mgnify:CR=1 FL=1